MRFLVDTSVVLDVVLQRPFHEDEAAMVWALCERSIAQGMVASVAHTTLAYLVQESSGFHQGADDLDNILCVFGVAAVGTGELRTALADI
jgi:hypothetical protein